ncbi:hypothetical protein TMatcc_009490, partial [Talaromyces marneffei ATCC 18224]
TYSVLVPLLLLLGNSPSISYTTNRPCERLSYLFRVILGLIQTEKMSSQDYYGQQPHYGGGYPNQPPQAHPPQGGYYPPQQPGYGPPQGYPPQGYQQPPPPQQYQQEQRGGRDHGCLGACLATLCCCFLCEESCECCFDCIECCEGC